MPHRRAVSALRPLCLLAFVLVLGLAWAHHPLRAQDRPGAARVPIRLYVFDGGRLESDPARYQMTAQQVGGVTQLSVAAYLVVHPNGVLLWDAGAVPDEIWTPTGSPVRQHLVLPDGQERDVTITQRLGAQLASAGYSPGQVTHLALSHYHWDHTANANAFAQAIWLVQEPERDAMFGGTAAGTSNAVTYAALRTSRTVIVREDEHDVFGDGTVILKRAAGHTPGHQVLYLKLPETGGVVLSGDLYHYPQERTLGTLPTFEVDAGATRMARAALETFLARTNARLWIQHDFTAHAALRKAPEFYQ